MEVERIGIVGAGLIGRGWAIVFARAGYQVALYDNDPDALSSSLVRLDESLRDLALFGLIDETSEAIRARITPTHDLADAVRDADYVQENVLEVVDAKVEVTLAIDALARPDCIIGSSTSTIPASVYSATVPGRRRCLVVHPVQPVHLIPVVELSPAPWTDPAVTAQTADLLRRVGQSPIVLRREIQGFVVNRLQAALLCEAFTLWEAGYASADEIDRTIRDGLGLRWSFMGPLETFDLAAPGGVVDSAARYGPTFHAMAAGAVPTPFGSEAVARLAAERSTIQPRETLPTEPAGATTA